jgi:hypothetical protein
MGASKPVVHPINEHVCNYARHLQNPSSQSIAIADTGTTGHYFQPHSACLNITPTHKPVTVNMPQGTSIQSTHTGELPLPQLPASARVAHIFPDLANHSLISIGVLCDHNCVATFAKDNVTVSHNNEPLLTGPRSSNGLWTIDLQQAILTPQATPTPSPVPSRHALAAIEDSTIADQMAFLHSACFSPVPSTLIQAIDNGHFTSWPGFSSHNIKHHLPKSLATAYGHLDQKRKGIRSTQPKPTQPVGLPAFPMDTINADPIPDHNTSNHVCYAIDDTTGRVYSDQTGRFPVQATTGNKYVVVVYDYDSNAILAEPIANRRDTSIRNAISKLHQRLRRAGVIPKTHILDNEASNLLKSYFTTEEMEWQLVPPHTHRANAAERAIRTFKNHFIAGLCSTDPNFPVYLWDQLIPQAELTLNLLRKSRRNPKLSAHAFLHGQFNFNNTPLAPPGTLTIGHEKPSNRGSWAPHGSQGWYIGPAPEHYRCYQLYMPKTRATRIFDTVEFFPTKVNMPTLSSTDTAIKAAAALTDALQNPAPAAPFAPLSQATQQALTDLAQIFAHALPRVPKGKTQVPPKTPSPPRVETPVTNQHVYQTRSKTLQANAAIQHRTSTWHTGALQHLIAREQTSSTTVDHLRPRTLTTPLADTFIQATALDRALEPCCNAIIDKESGKALGYHDLLKMPAWKNLITTSSANEFGRLTQGIRDIKGTETMKWIKVSQVPSGCTATYARFVCDYRPQKAEPYRTRITVGGDKIDYPGDVSTRTADLLTSKCLWNSVLSKRKRKLDARYACFDIGSFYLETPMDRPEYMRFRLADIPQEIIDHYNLLPLLHHGFVYVEINKGMYGLPQAGKLANDLLAQRLAKHGYYQSPYTCGLWKHTHRPIQFTLIVDDFGVEYVGREHADHLFHAIQAHYKCSVDWTGSLYSGITLGWDYEKNTLDTSMPGYATAALHKFQHPLPKLPQDAPYPSEPIQYGAKIQMTKPTDVSPQCTPAQIKTIQQIVGTFLYYARAIDSTMNVSLSSLASEQLHATANTQTKINQFLDYAATHPNAIVRFHASDMQLHIHSDASYLSEPKSRSRAAGHFYLGNHATGPPMTNNGAILSPTGILRHVVSSAAEAEFGGLFVNSKEGTVVRAILADMGWPQDPTIITTDNSTAAGITNDTIKQNRSKAMDMRFYWIKDRVAQNHFRVTWAPGDDNLADYGTKHHSAPHHRRQRSRYLANIVTLINTVTEKCAPQLLLRGCVKSQPPRGTNHTQTGTKSVTSNSWRQQSVRPL